MSFAQVLGTGAISKAITVKAASFSESAKAAIEAAGGKAEVVPGRAKWTRKAYTAAKTANPNYEAERLKKKVASLVKKVRGGSIVRARWGGGLLPLSLANGQYRVMLQMMSFSCICRGTWAQHARGCMDDGQ